MFIINSKINSFLLSVNEYKEDFNNLYEYNLKIINTFYSFLRLSYLIYIVTKELTLFYSKNYVYKVYKLPTLEQLNLIENITSKLEELNIVYVKIFQSLCLDNNILNENEKEYLLKYTDNVPYHNDEIEYDFLNTLEEKYNITLENVEPINAGIVGLAFSGINKKENNSKVIIKILKKDITNKINNALNELVLASYILQFIPFLNNLNLYKLIVDNKESFCNQVDFIKEVSNIELLTAKNKNLSAYRFPKVYKTITNEYNNIIVMENIKGLTINEVKIMDQSIKDEFGKLYVKFGLIGLLYNNAIHNDLHSGNLFFYKNEDSLLKPQYQLGLIDFGICSFPSKENQNIYYTFFVEVILNKNYRDVGSMLKGIINEKENYEILNNHEKTIFKNNCIKCFEKFESNDLDVNFLFELGKILKKYKFTFTKEFNEIIMGLYVINNLAKELCSDLNKTQKEVINELTQINKIIEII
jgi:predicted unusual protein kinase regulating ubiquinone biosynthesis (AarF/ABC1/UbiB family)